MLQKEFEDRIGRKVSESEFVEANAMYMLAGDDMDKDTFCREWKKIGNSPLVRGLYETAYQKGKRVMELDAVQKEWQGIINDTADSLLEIGKGVLDGKTAENTIEELERKAWFLVGRKEVIKRKARMQIPFSEEEIEYINNNLK